MTAAITNNYSALPLPPLAPTAADRLWELFATIVTAGFYILYNAYKFEAAVLTGDLQAAQQRRSWGAKISDELLADFARATDTLTPTARASVEFIQAHAAEHRLFNAAREQGNGHIQHYLAERAQGIDLSTSQQLDRWLVEGGEEPILTHDQWAFGAAAAAFRLRQRGAEHGVLRKAVARLKAMDRELFTFNREHAYRAELRHAIRLLKASRDAAQITYRDEGERRLHDIAMRAMEHADAVIRTSTNCKYRNVRPTPFLPSSEQSPIGRWMEHGIYGRDNWADPAPLRLWTSEIAEVGIGNCLHFAAVAADWIRTNAPDIAASLYVIDGGDHVFTRAKLGAHSFLIDPWAVKVYRWKDQTTELRDYIGQGHPNKAQFAFEAKPYLVPLSADQRVVPWNYFDFTMPKE